MFEAARAQLAALDRSGAYHRVLWHLTTVLNSRELRRISASTIASRLGISRSNTERALAQLEADFVVIAEGRGAAKMRRLSRRVMWDAGAELYSLQELDQTDPPVRDGREVTRFRDQGVDLDEAPEPNGTNGHRGS